MFEAFGGERWWPLNSLVTVLRTRPAAVMEALDPDHRWIRAEHRDLDAAVAALAPFGYRKAPVDFLIPTADGGTVVLHASAPGGHLFGLLHHAAGPLRCDAVAIEWAPAMRGRLAGAGFDDYRYAPPPPAGNPGPRDTDELTVQVSDQGSRWELVRIPPGRSYEPRSYEEPEHYAARRVADRFPLELLRRYVVAAGIPADDPGYLTGPVLTRSWSARPVVDQTWTTMAELRVIAGYPAEGIPTDLRTTPVFEDDAG